VDCACLGQRSVPDRPWCSRSSRVFRALSRRLPTSTRTRSPAWRSGLERTQPLDSSSVSVVCLRRWWSQPLIGLAGWRYKRWLSLEPSSMAGFFGGTALLVTGWQSQWNSMLRLTGWLPNGNDLRPGFEGYFHDSAQPVVKMDRSGAAQGRKRVSPDDAVPDMGNIRV
jgi:hypothetical protein